MPVDTRAIVLQVIFHVDNQCVTPFCADCRPRILSIDEHHWSIATASIWIWLCDIGDFKVVLHTG